jgi:hypothetical protein
VGFGLAILLLLWHWPSARRYKRLKGQPA